MKNEPLEENLHYGMEEREFLDRDPIQPDLLPTPLNLLRWKLNQDGPAHWAKARLTRYADDCVPRARDEPMSLARA